MIPLNQLYDSNCPALPLLRSGGHVPEPRTTASLFDGNPADTSAPGQCPGPNSPDTRHWWYTTGRMEQSVAEFWCRWCPDRIWD